MAGKFTEARRETVRTEIIATAERVFTRNGVAATSMGQIAEAVGIGRPALYHYFPSKDDLVAATIKAAVDRYESFGAIPDETSFEEATTYFTTALVRNIAGNDGSPLRFFFTVLLEQFDNPTENQPVRAIIDSYREMVADLVRRGQKQGDVPDDVDHSAIADRLTAQILGIEWMWLLYQGQVDLASIANQAEQEFLNACRRGAPRDPQAPPIGSRGSRSYEVL